MARFGRGFLGRQDTPGRLGFEQPIPVPPVAPSATTLAATGITATLATLNGTVNPNGQATTAYFQWGTTTGYGNTTTSQNAGSGSSNVAISQALTGLTLGQTYHYRIVATSSAGTTYGADQSWVAANPAPALGQSSQGRAPVVLAADKITIRQVAPAGVIWPGNTTPPAQGVTVLGQTLYARDLPCSLAPSSPDAISYTYTTRREDAGEGTVTFPNTEASDGVLWRSRWDPTGRLQWFEVWVGGELECVLCADTVAVDDGRGFASTVDGTTFACSLQGNGAGVQNGSTGQLQAKVYDPATLQAALYDVQAWQDFPDASFPQLLQTLLESQLALELSPWQLLTADGQAGGQGLVVVHGQDGMFLLKGAYERDWTVVQSPRDVIERSTQVSLSLVEDKFPAGSLSGQWTVSATSGASATIGTSGGCVLSVTGASEHVTVASAAKTVTATGVWQASVYIQTTTALNQNQAVALQLIEANGDEYVVWLWGQQGVLTAPNSANVAYATLPSSTTWGLMLESDGEWVLAYVNGVLVGVIRRTHATTTSLQVQVGLSTNASGSATTTTITGALLEAQQPLLMPGTDKGDYVLPGNAATYPNGGLHARYFNNADLASDANRLMKIHAPPRTQAYGTSTVSEYVDQQDATINAQANPTPGASTSNWSAIWFGSIWLELSKGDYTFTLTVPNTANNYALRAWVGKTQFGTQLVDAWSFTNTASQVFTFTVTASALAGTLSYGRGTVQRDGWYPIKIEYAVDATSAAAPVLKLTSSPAAYTDPGGTSIASGAQSTVVPATSLSPLGCVDQRYQGISHFDLCQQTLQAYGYQASVEPKQLESGLFPGVLAPRIREGQDYATVVEPDKGAAQDGLLLMRPEQTKTWPLPGSVANMRWRPGDGIRIQDRDINVWDTSPRQILTFTRTAEPGGITAGSASFANRPITPAKVLKKLTYATSRPQRNYQRQMVTLTGSYQGSVSIPGGTTGTSSSYVSLQPGDTLIQATLRVNYNSVGASFNVVVNGTDQTSTLNGPWAIVPLSLNLLPVAVPDTSNQLNVTLKNNGATSASFSWQLFCDVLR